MMMRREDYIEKVEKIGGYCNEKAILIFNKQQNS
jgi:hypothetical protein